MKKVSYLLVFIVSMAFIVGCGGGAEKVTLSEKGELLAKYAWKLQPNETISENTGNFEDSTGIEADIVLDGDVGKIADFFAETLVIGVNKKGTKFSYSRTIGEGFLSSETWGYWNFNDDESEILLRKWNDETNAEDEAVAYKIVEVNDEKLVLENTSNGGINVYFPK